MATFEVLRVVVGALLVVTGCQSRGPVETVCAPTGGGSAANVPSPGPKTPSPENSSDAAAPAFDGYYSCEGGFAVAFPRGGVFIEQMLVVNIPNGTLRMPPLARAAGKISYAVAWTELPPSSVASRGAEQVLRDFQDGVLAANRGVLESEQVAIQDGAPARFFTYVASKSGNRLKMVAALKDNREYAIGVTIPRSETEDAGQVRRFLHSLVFAQIDCLGH
jgi:hypothetical protein